MDLSYFSINLRSYNYLIKIFVAIDIDPWGYFFYKTICLFEIIYCNSQCFLTKKDKKVLLDENSLLKRFAVRYVVLMIKPSKVMFRGITFEQMCRVSFFQSFSQWGSSRRRHAPVNILLFISLALFFFTIRPLIYNVAPTE